MTPEQGNRFRLPTKARTDFHLIYTLRTILAEHPEGEFSFMKTSKLLNTAIAGMMVFGLAVMAAPSNPAAASSHREAPGISGDPKADPTDVYAFVSPDNTNTVTLIANWIPLEQP